MADLRQTWAAIRDGEATWDSFVQTQEEDPRTELLPQMQPAQEAIDIAGMVQTVEVEEKPLKEEPKEPKVDVMARAELAIKSGEVKSEEEAIELVKSLNGRMTPKRMEKIRAMLAEQQPKSPETMPAPTIEELLADANQHVPMEHVLGMYLVPWDIAEHGEHAEKIRMICGHILQGRDMRHEGIAANLEILVLVEAGTGR